MTTLPPALERRLSIQDVRDVPLLTHQRHTHRYVYASARKYRRAPTRFAIQLSRQPDDADDQTTTCYPGAVLEGVVHIELTEPLAAHQLKLVFKATERINYEALGWGQPRPNEGRLFAIRTTLWGTSEQTADSSARVWPILEAGKHAFPFMCELPRVNYPPTIHHRLVSCVFCLVASLERPGDRPFQTKQCQVQFRPAVETQPEKALSHFTEERHLNQWTTAHIHLPSLAYHLLDTTHIPVRLLIRAAHTSSIAHVRVCLKRSMRITNAAYYRNETQLISQVEAPVKGPNSSGLMNIALPLPAGLVSTLRYCPRLTVEYKITVSAKMRLGPLWTKRKLFSVPIVLGTLPPGTNASEVRVYTDSRVVQDTTLDNRPKFLRPPSMDDQLPAYDTMRPPGYSARTIVPVC